MIELVENSEIARGTNRACFMHPLEPNKCIKVTISNDYSESEKEIKYYKFLEKKNISWDYISKYYGSVSTNLGKGEVFDLIKDYDGNVSKTFSFYLQSDEKTKSILNPLSLMLTLKKYTLKESIIVKDLNTKNILYQKISNCESKLILVDGLSINSFFLFYKYFDFLTRKKILILWKNFEKSLFEKYKFNSYFINLLKENF